MFGWVTEIFFIKRAKCLNQNLILQNGMKIEKEEEFPAKKNEMLIAQERVTNEKVQGDQQGS